MLRLAIVPHSKFSLCGLKGAKRQKKKKKKKKKKPLLPEPPVANLVPLASISILFF
jgi:hypothetical protein